MNLKHKSQNLEHRKKEKKVAQRSVIESRKLSKTWNVNEGRWSGSVCSGVADSVFI